MLDFELSTNHGLSFEAQSTDASFLLPSMTRKRGQAAGGFFRHIIVSPLRTGVEWMVHEPSAVAKLRLRHGLRFFDAVALDWNRSTDLIAASDLLHAAVIPANRDRSTATSVAAFVTVAAISVIALTPTGAADVNAYAARTDVHTLSQRRCWSRDS
jgi:hypothetical protein